MLFRSSMCDKVHWVDDPWPLSLRNSLAKVWAMHEEESFSRLHGNVDHATKYYKLLQEKKELENRNMELHKQVGNALEYVAEVTANDPQLEVARREKAEQEVLSLRLDNKKMVKELAKRPKADGEFSTLKEEKKKLEYYVADLLKVSHGNKEKMKKIMEICGE